MTRKSEPQWPAVPNQRVSVAIGIFGSLFMHLLIYGSVRGMTTVPELDFEVQLPSEVEFGLTEEVITDPPLQTASVEEANPPKAQESKPQKKEIEAESTAILESDKEQKKKLENKEAVDKEGQPNGEDATTDAGTSRLAAYAPPGTQFALRLNMQRVRISPLATEVNDLLAVIPDWALILEGSGIRPVEHLDRLFLASPNLQRSSLVIAGQHPGDKTLPQQAVESLASARGEEARWTKQNNIDVAPWLNRDKTERIIALVAPSIFIITRPDDLQRVLAVSEGLAKRRKKNKRIKEKGIDALLAMEENQTLSVSIEGARQFVRGNLKGIPTRLTASVIENETGIEIIGEGIYDSEAEAEQARKYWTAVRKQIASHPLIIFAGMREPLANSTIEQNEETLTAKTSLTLQQVRVLLGFLHNALANPNPIPKKQFEESDNTAPDPNPPLEAR